ncbi:carboxypeptidase B-like isoform X2 [Vanessa cardui]|uniref:carboxypeptidase B-like isoform X2 n=1 Tax=Vanessa cardui TaxID=171605 RepID=UPI001F12C1F0|nr:carboxypeptidase B-like isoform X2 [Vanessa cardui]
MFMRAITFALIFLCIVWCEIDKGKTTKDLVSTKYWKSEISDVKNQSIKNKAIDKNVKSNLRQRESQSKKDDQSSKWPKETRYNKKKVKSPHLASSEVVDSVLSPYSIKHQLLHYMHNISDANVTIDVIGRTVEYNDIVLLKITENKEDPTKRYLRTDEGKYAEDSQEKKIIFIVHGLSVMGANNLECLSYEYAFLKLLSYYTAHLNKFDIFLIPMANPDGIVELRTQNKIWNKNASPQNDCPGVALDRNFDIAWHNNDSINSCHQDYPGPEPFSEAESRAIRDIFHKYSHKIIAYLNLHSGTYDYSTFKGDAVLYPKGYTESSDDDKYIDLKGEIDEAMRNASFKVLSVTVDTLYSWYGKVTGSSVDYASEVYGIPYTLELVMQIYETPLDYEEHPDYDDHALVEVWERVIDVILSFIWKSQNGNEIQ